MFAIIMLLVVSIIFFSVFDEDRKDRVLNEFCNNECISRQNKKRTFCC